MYRTLLLTLFTAVLSFAADITGKWELRGTSSTGDEARVQLVIAESAGKYSATLYAEEDSVPVQGLTVSGDQVSFKIPTDDTTYTVKLTLKDGTAEGTYSASDGTSGKVSGKKV